MSAHTPGPWVVHHETMIGHENAGGMWAVAEVGRIPHNGQRFHSEFDRRWQADARLIAAAPRMYDYIKGQAGRDCHRYDKHFRTRLPVSEQSCGECDSCRARAILRDVEGQP